MMRLDAAGSIRAGLRALVVQRARPLQDALQKVTGAYTVVRILAEAEHAPAPEAAKAWSQMPATSSRRRRMCGKARAKAASLASRPVRRAAGVAIPAEAQRISRSRVGIDGVKAEFELDAGDQTSSASQQRLG